MEVIDPESAISMSLRRDEEVSIAKLLKMKVARRLTFDRRDAAIRVERRSRVIRQTRCWDCQCDDEAKEPGGEVSATCHAVESYWVPNGLKATVVGEYSAFHNYGVVVVRKRPIRTHHTTRWKPQLRRFPDVFFGLPNQLAPDRTSDSVRPFCANRRWH